jgi:hypothetical protein
MLVTIVPAANAPVTTPTTMSELFDRLALEAA